MSEDSEEARAFLQDRVALFWKVTFFIILFGSGLGAVGAVAQRGWDFWLTLTVTTQSGIFWWVCRSGRRSIRFSRLMESAGLVFSVTLGAATSRYLLVGVTHDRALVDPSAIMMADAFVAMLQLFGTGLLVAIRAALVPSRPRRTLVVSALAGIPPILADCFLLPGPSGMLERRPLDSPIFPWLPGTFVIMWIFVVITSTQISRIIYGLRAQVREARRLGQYVLESKIGEGGMGQVFRARHGMMRRPSAIKLLRGTQASEQQLRRFEREVQLTARLTHPNTITIFDYGRTDDGIFYYAMELLEGATLQRIVEVDGRQPVSRVVRMLSMACAALSEAHGIGLIHRDIKPANIMACFQGGEHDVIKLLDFGLVKELAVAGEAQLTGVSTLVGTPQYLPPESILQADAADARSDIYALGAVAYYLLAGVDVFDGTSVINLCIQHIHQAPESLRARGIDVPAALDELILQCLAKNPADRPQSAAELRSKLEACDAGKWTEEDAKIWWRDHQPELASEQRTSEQPTQTIDVGAARRNAEP